eukprot:957017-Amphidinium_carterae.1
MVDDLVLVHAAFSVLCKGWEHVICQPFTLGVSLNQPPQGRATSDCRRLRFSAGADSAASGSTILLLRPGRLRPAVDAAAPDP